MHIVLVHLYPFLLPPFQKGYRRNERYSKVQNRGAKGCGSYHRRKTIRPSSVGVQVRDTHSVPLEFIATGCCRGQKHKDIKGFTSEILRFMKVKVAADWTQLLAKPVMDGQGCEVKEICHCFLFSSHKHFLLAAVRGRHLSSGELVACTSRFYALTTHG